MNREILFRGKRVDNGDWMCGSIISFDDGSKVILPSSAEVFMQNGTSTICCNECYDVDPSTVGQYTGLTDKNGVKIFEGDILSSDLSRPYSIVIWKNGAFMLECEDSGSVFHDIFYSCSEEPQTSFLYENVIGNIHDNPDLLKEV